MEKENVPETTPLRVLTNMIPLPPLPPASTPSPFQQLQPPATPSFEQPSPFLQDLTFSAPHYNQYQQYPPHHYQQPYQQYDRQHSTPSPSTWHQQYPSNNLLSMDKENHASVDENDNIVPATPGFSSGKRPLENVGDDMFQVNAVSVPYYLFV